MPTRNLRPHNSRLGWTGLVLLLTIMTSLATRVNKLSARDVQYFHLSGGLGETGGIRDVDSCCVLCATTDKCAALLYHKTEHTCKLGSRIEPGMTGISDDLFLFVITSDKPCPLEFGYRRFTEFGLDLCVMVNSMWLTFADARAKCQSDGGNLYHMDRSRERMDAIKVFVKEFDYIARMWIGLSDIEREGEMVWVYNGRKVLANESTLVDWDPGEPNNLYGKEDCVEFLRNVGQLNDQHCLDARGFVCEILLN